MNIGYEVNWKCPNCKTVNTDDIGYALDNLCKCTNCNSECMVSFDVVAYFKEAKVIE
jgi:hypothetical protein